jgi:hypothetical protein
MYSGDYAAQQSSASIPPWLADLSDVPEAAAVRGTSIQSASPWI